MMLPDATVALLAVVTCADVRPAPVIAEIAAASDRPTTFGTSTLAGPSETVNAMPVPGAWLVPAGGAWLMTMPAAVALLTPFTEPTVRPAAARADAAAACVTPTTFGTSAPTAMTTFTVLPNALQRAGRRGSG